MRIFRIKSFDQVISVMFLLLVMGLAAPFALKPVMTEIEISADWRSIFKRFQDVGSNCKVAFLPANDSLSDDVLLQESKVKAKAFLVPFRAEPSYKSLPEGHSAYVSCDVLPQKTDEYTSPILYLGPIWGNTVVYFKGQEVRRYYGYASVTVNLTKEQASAPFTFEILSRNFDNGAGPMSLIPFVLLPSETNLRTVQRVLTYSFTEKTLVPLGIAGTLSILFLLCWYFGVRYRDVYWMIVACCAAAGSAGLLHYPEADPPEWYIQFRYFVDLICWSSLWVAIYTFLRRPAKQRYLVLFVLGIACLGQLQFLVPKPIMRELIGNIGRHDGIWIGTILLVLSYFALRIDMHLPKRRYLQRRILGALLFFFGVWVMWAGFYAFRIGFTADNITRTSLLAIFGAFMMIDLVIFQRAYFEEKSLKEEEERRRSALEDRMELGFSIQRLLMPGAQSREYGGFRINVLYECADLMAGDWFYWCESSSELRVLCGDVVGKGPQAAIAATSILTMCHNFNSEEIKLENYLSRLNKTVVELFQAKPISTIGAVALGTDGTARVLNHGFSGWLHVKKDAVEFISQRGASLGTDRDISWPTLPVHMNIGDRLVIFSDGVVEGPRAIKKLCDTLKGTNSMPVDQLLQVILEVGKNSVVEDDKTILIVEKFK